MQSIKEEVGQEEEFTKTETGQVLSLGKKESLVRLYTPIADEDYSNQIASTNPDEAWRKVEEIMNTKKRELLEK